MKFQMELIYSACLLLTIIRTTLSLPVGTMGNEINGADDQITDLHQMNSLTHDNGNQPIAGLKKPSLPQQDNATEVESLDFESKPSENGNELETSIEDNQIESNSRNFAAAPNQRDAEPLDLPPPKPNDLSNDEINKPNRDDPGIESDIDSIGFIPVYNDAISKPNAREKGSGSDIESMAYLPLNMVAPRKPKIHRVKPLDFTPIEIRLLYFPRISIPFPFFKVPLIPPVNFMPRHHSIFEPSYNPRSSYYPPIFDMKPFYYNSNNRRRHFSKEPRYW